MNAKAPDTEVTHASRLTRHGWVFAPLALGTGLAAVAAVVVRVVLRSSSPPLDFWGPMIPSAALALIVLSGLVLLGWKVRSDAPPWFSAVFLIGALVLSGFGANAAILALNGLLDRSPDVTHRAQVLDVSTIRESRTYYVELQVASWRRDRGSEGIELAKGQEKLVRPGDFLDVTTRAGALGFPTVSRVTRLAAGNDRGVPLVLRGRSPRDR